MTNKAISIFNQLRPLSVGYDDIFSNFERMFDHQMDTISVPNYPPYNIIKTGPNDTMIYKLHLLVMVRKI